MHVDIVIDRYSQDDNQTLGVCSIIKDGEPVFAGISLERGWRNNKSNVSCIPIGIYPMTLEYSSRFKKELWEIKEVVGRSECKFHSASFFYDLQGCISLGDSIAHINKDNYRDLLNSRGTMRKFHKALEGCTNVKLIVK